MNKSAFMMQNGRAVSMIVGRDTIPTAFLMGEEYTLGSPVDLAHLGILPKGTKFVVEDHDPHTGVVTLKAKCENQCSLRKWCQRVLLQPYSTDDIVTRLVKVRVTSRTVRALQIAAVLALITFTPAPWNWAQAYDALCVVLDCPQYGTMHTHTQ